MLSEHSPLAGLEGAQLKLSLGYSLELCKLQARLLAHFSYLSVSAFMDAYRQLSIIIAGV